MTSFNSRKIVKSREDRFNKILADSDFTEMALLVRELLLLRKNAQYGPEKSSIVLKIDQLAVVLQELAILMKESKWMDALILYGEHFATGDGIFGAVAPSRIESAQNLQMYRRMIFKLWSCLCIQLNEQVHVIAKDGNLGLFKEHFAKICVAAEADLLRMQNNFHLV